MFYAAICDDEQDIARYLEKTLAVEFSRNNVQVSFDIFSNGSNLLEMLADHYHFDIVFMDIEMAGTDGISICKQLRKANYDTLVIFISNKDELVFSTFEVQPFRFIRKSHYDQLLPSLVPAIITELSRRNPATLTIVEPRSGDLFSFDAVQIRFVEAQGKSCLIHSDNDTTEMRIKLMEVAEQLADYEFIKPHRSYLVNCKYISSIQKNTITLTNGELIPISRNRLENIKSEFIKYTNRSL